MNECKRIYLDTSPIIYYLEKNETYFASVQLFLSQNAECDYVTSTITITEYLVFPLQQNKLNLVNDLYAFLDNMEINVFDINKKIAEKAAKIRVEYTHFKTMDSLQLATACVTGCDLFLTNDKQLKQFKEINVELVSEMQI